MRKKEDPQVTHKVYDAIAALEQALSNAGSVIGEALSELGPKSALKFAPQEVSASAMRFDAGFQPQSLNRLDAQNDEAILQELAAAHELDVPADRLIRLRNERYPQSRPRYWGIANFDLHSSKPRFFVFDVASQSVSPYLCAHGVGSEGPSDDGFANTFSNTEGSNATSLGIYRCAETYSGHNGYSLRLDGLEETNSRARVRAVVIHGADYVSKKFSDNYGRIGRSEGCPALDHEYSSTVIDQLKQGSLLLHWKTP